MELMWSPYGVHMEFMWSNIIFLVEYCRILQYLYCLSCSAIQKPFTYFWVDYGRFQAGHGEKSILSFTFPMFSGYTVVRAIYIIYIYIYIMYTYIFIHIICMIVYNRTIYMICLVIIQITHCKLAKKCVDTYGYLLPPCCFCKAGISICSFCKKRGTKLVPTFQLLQMFLKH